MKKKIAIHWFRRDLRLEDNTALDAALKSPFPVLPLFVFDTTILDDVNSNDSRVSFIYKQLEAIHHALAKTGHGVLVKKGKPEDIWLELQNEYDIASVFFNRDYEPYAVKRDAEITSFLTSNNIQVHSYKDHVIHEAHEVLKKDGTPYLVFTPYKKQWIKHYAINTQNIKPDNSTRNFLSKHCTFPSLHDLGFVQSRLKVHDFQLDDLENYANTRDIPSLDSTSYLGPHLRFGTVSIRQVLQFLSNRSPVFLSELIWREFFMQILVHYPHVLSGNYRSKYNDINWLNDEHMFKQWCVGQTGYPIVDAGMRQLNATGYMHNRVRMITASFLCKHLLIDWRWGEAYFAEKLLDYELASNNGNWQWVAGTGCDAAPYFRVFNPSQQQLKFDPNYEYIKKWVPEFGQPNYPQAIVDHKSARIRAISAYKASTP